MPPLNLEQALRTAFSTILLPLLLGGGCLGAAGTAGCQSDDVAGAFGYTAPGIHASYSVFGASIDVSSDLDGFVELDWDTNGVLHVKATLNSKASDVTDAQGRRITEQFLEGRRIEWDGKEKQAIAVGQNFIAFGAMVAQVTNSLGKEAAVPIVGEIAALLRGSGGTIDLPGFGSGTINLGKSNSTPANATGGSP